MVELPVHVGVVIAETVKRHQGARRTAKRTKLVRAASPRGTGEGLVGAAVARGRVRNIVCHSVSFRPVSLQNKFSESGSIVGVVYEPGQ